jgi:hypothetical protein
MTGVIDETKFTARDRWNDRLVREVRYTGPSAAAGGYLTGGDPIGPGDVGMGDIFGVYGGYITDGTTIRVPVWNYTTQKLQFFVPNTNAEVANAVDLSAFSGTILFTGKG